MSGKRIHTLILGLLLSLALLGSAHALMNGGGGGSGEGTTCARCVGDTCGGGYASGGTDCVIQCKWNSKTRDFDMCSCYTTGDCPGKTIGSTLQ